MDKIDNIEMTPIYLPDGYLFVNRNNTYKSTSPKKVAKIKEFSPEFFKKITNKSDYSININNLLNKV